jgi:hypothetical protein
MLTAQLDALTVFLEPQLLQLLLMHGAILVQDSLLAPPQQVLLVLEEYTTALLTKLLELVAELLIFQLLLMLLLILLLRLLLQPFSVQQQLLEPTKPLNLVLNANGAS